MKALTEQSIVFKGDDEVAAVPAGAYWRLGYSSDGGKLALTMHGREIAVLRICRQAEAVESVKLAFRQIAEQRDQALITVDLSS